jgi:hypothetical protein
MNIYNIDYKMLYSLRQHVWPVICQKLWHYSNICINNDYFVNKLSTSVFQSISIIIHCNNILNETLFLILHLRIITWKWQEQGPLFQVRRGPKSSWNFTVCTANENAIGSVHEREHESYILVKILIYIHLFISTMHQKLKSETQW